MRTWAVVGHSAAHANGCCSARAASHTHTHSVGAHGLLCRGLVTDLEPDGRAGLQQSD